MVRKSNKIAVYVAVMSLICAIIVIAGGVWFALKQGEECARLERWDVAWLGVAILVVALVGFIGAYCDCRPVLCIYPFFMAASIVILGVLLLIGFVVTRGSGAYPVLGRAYDEYRLNGFSMWLRGYVSDDPGRWEGIKSCLADTDTCKTLARQGSVVTADQFYRSNLTPLQSGCCKPPSVCGFGYVAPTVWTNPTSAANGDCGLWSNDPGQLCYECESCRAALLATVRSQWYKANIAFVVSLFLLLVIFVVGCIAFKKSSTSAYKPYKGWMNRLTY